MGKLPKIGAHISVAGGIYNAIENAKNIGVECFQIFGSSPRQWRVRMPSDEDVVRFRKDLRGSGLGPVYLHAAYLVNLASPDADILKKSVDSLTNHLKIASVIRAAGLIFHVGSGRGADRERALLQEVQAIGQVLKATPGRTRLLMENTAGGGDRIGSIQDIAYLHERIGSHRLGVCFDTAHAFEAGLLEQYNKKTIRQVFDLWDEAVGLDNVEVIHVNDSKTVYGSHHDKHENIGEGYIGLGGFKALARERRLRDKVWILEVPGFDGSGPDKRNVDILRSCFSLS